MILLPVTWVVSRQEGSMRNFRRYSRLVSLAFLAILAMVSGPTTETVAAAETFPSKLIKVVVPLSAGSPIDLIARIIAPALSSRLKQSVIVENRPGGGTTTGTRAVAAAPADGYTLL